VDAEHRFTAFSEQVIELLKSKVDVDGTASLRSNETLLFLMNAPGNRHNLGVRILAIWLESRGASVRIIDDGTDRESLMRSVAADRPKYLLISMALTEQRGHVVEIANAAQALPADVRPKVIVGGYPVKAGLIEAIPAAELLSDISVLHIS